MITIHDITLNNFPLEKEKGCLCVGQKEGETHKKCCGHKKKLPVEKGGRLDLDNKLRTQ